MKTRICATIGWQGSGLWCGAFCPPDLACVRDFLFKTCKLKLCKGKLSRARVLQNLRVEDVKTKLSCEFPSKSASWSCAMEAFVRDFLQNLQVEDVKTKLSWKTSDFQNCSLQGTVLCSHCFIAVIVFLQSSFFAVIPLCSHCSLQSLCFAIILLCSHGSLRSWSLAVLETDASGRPAERLFLSRKYSHETVDGQKDQTLQTPTK